MYLETHALEWKQSGIDRALIDLNLLSLEETEIAEWYFQYLPSTARRNDGRVRDGYLRAYREPLKGGWGIKGYDPTDWDKEPELRCFKPNSPRIGSDGQPIRYDLPKNSSFDPIFPRVSYAIASLIFRSAGLNFLELTQKYAPHELVRGIVDNAECPWFWLAVLDNPIIPISITEGGKKALSLLSVGRCAVAVTSITTWREYKGSKKLHPWLALFSPQRSFYLTFDQDEKPKTKKAVNLQSLKLGTALTRLGASKVRRISWSGTSKGIDDFIYLLKHKYGDRYCQKIIRKCYQNARSYLKFDKSQQLPGKIKKVDKQYLELSDLAEAASCKLLIVKSAKSTGKTEIVTELVARDRHEGTPTINLVHLERLAREAGIRLELPYRTEKGTVSLRNALGYSLCLDSFTPDNSVPFHPEHWSDAGLIMDEFTQSLHHLAFGSTELKKYRKLVLATLGQKLADCWANNKPIRLLDADANVESIELIYELIQLYSDREITRDKLEDNTFTLVNEYKSELGKLYFYDEPSPKQIRADLVTRMKQQKNLFIVTSAQKPNSGDGTVNLEELAKKHYLPSEILRIDRLTTGDPTHPAFNINGDRLRELIYLGNYKVIIASPTICTGISIDEVDGYFDAVFSFQSGNLTPNSVRQQLVRLRDFLVPRYLWCPKIGQGFIGSASTNPIELLTDQKGEAKLGLQLLGFKAAEQLIESNVCPLTKYWSVSGAFANREKYHYRAYLLYQLEEEGWKVITRFPHDDDTLQKAWDERKEIKSESVRCENTTVATASELSHSEASTLERKRNLTAAQQAQLDKYRLQQKYSIEEITPELVAADRKKFYSTLRLRFWLTKGREYLERSDRELLEKTQERNDGRFFIPDFNQKISITKVKLLELLNLERFERARTQWSNNSIELIELKEFVGLDLVRFNQILRCSIAITDSPITVVQKIFKQIGKQLPYQKNLRNGNKRLRIYGAATSKFNLDAVETEILENWSSYYLYKYSAETDFAA